MELPKKPVKFSLVVQIYKGQLVLRTGPSRIIWRFLLDLPVDKNHPVTAFALTSNPIENKEISASWTPCPDTKALERGKPDEDKKYLEPKEGSFWNDTKNTFSSNRQLTSGTVTFLIINDFWKFLIKSKHLKGLYTLMRQDTSDLWTWKKSAGPGQKKD